MSTEDQASRNQQELFPAGRYTRQSAMEDKQSEFISTNLDQPGFQVDTALHVASAKERAFYHTSSGDTDAAFESADESKNEHRILTRASLLAYGHTLLGSSINLHTNTDEMGMSTVAAYELVQNAQFGIGDPVSQIDEAIGVLQSSLASDSMNDTYATKMAIPSNGRTELATDIFELQQSTDLRDAIDTFLEISGYNAAEHTEIGPEERRDEIITKLKDYSLRRRLLDATQNPSSSRLQRTQLALRVARRNRSRRYEDRGIGYTLSELKQRNNTARLLTQRNPMYDYCIYNSGSNIGIEQLGPKQHELISSVGLAMASQVMHDTYASPYGERGETPMVDRTMTPSDVVRLAVRHDEAAPLRNMFNILQDGTITGPLRAIPQEVREAGGSEEIRIERLIQHEASRQNLISGLAGLVLSLSSASSEPKGRALIVVANKPYTDSVRNNLKEAEKLIPTIDTQYSPAIVGSAQILNALDNDLAQLYPNDTTLTLHGAVDNAKGARERQIRSTSSAHRTTEDKS